MFQTSAPLLQTEVTVLPGIYKKKKKTHSSRFIQRRTGQENRGDVWFLTQEPSSLPGRLPEKCNSQNVFLHEATSRYILSVSPWKTNRDKTKILPIRNELMQAAFPAYWWSFSEFRPCGLLKHNSRLINICQREWTFIMMVEKCRLNFFFKLRLFSLSLF